MTDNDPTEPPEDAISFWIARYLSAIESGQAFDRQALLDQAPELVADFDAFVDEHEALEHAFGNPTSASSLSDVEPGPTLDLTRKKRKSITVHEIPNKELGKAIATIVLPTQDLFSKGPIHRFTVDPCEVS